MVLLLLWLLRLLWQSRPPRAAVSSIWRTATSGIAASCRASHERRHAEQ
jgi:hypothetical protein